MTELIEGSGLRRERTLQSPRFREGRFHNAPIDAGLAKTLEGPRQPRSMLSTTSEWIFGGAARRPPGVLPIESPLETWRRPASTGLRATWLGHSTTLLEVDGYRVLTDPVWSDRISPVSFAGPRRFHGAPVAIAELPPLDAILVSHDHYDHFDAPSLEKLARRQPGVPFVTSLGVGARLEALGIPAERIFELDWWENATIPGTELTLTATPSRHFSGRSLVDRNRTLWSSWALKTARHDVFFSGDTGITPEFETIRQRMVGGGAFDLVMLEVGAFDQAWADIHLGPDNALVAHRMLGGGTLLPVHWGTFDLALHAWDEPVETLAARASELGVHVVTPRLGRAIEPTQVERIDPWWREVARAPVTTSRPARVV